MKNISLIFLFSLLFFSCKKNEIEENASLNIEKMSEVLADLHLTEAHLQQVSLEKRDSLRSVLYQQVFRSHQVSEEVFYSCHAIYFKNPTAVDSIYSRVLFILENKKVVF